jgi:Flp pilus assembly protein TadG
MEFAVNRRAMPRTTGFRRLRRIRRDERGAAVVEFALVAFPLFFILYGLIVFGMLLALKQSVTNAASEGARAAVGQATSSAQTSAATARVATSLSWLSSSSYTVTAPTAACGTHQCITVTINYDNAGHPLVPVLPGMGLLTPGTVTSTATVQVG